MKNNILLFMISLLFLSCQKTEEKKSFWDDFYKTPYVISEKNREYERYLDSLNVKDSIYQDSLELLGYERNVLSYPGILPPPPLPYYTETYGSGYGNLNVIFYKNEIYFHSQIKPIGCGTSFFHNQPDEELYFRNICIDSLTKLIDITQITNSIRYQKMNALDSTRYDIAVSSLSDTITNPIFNSLIDSVRKINPRFFVRRITEEEHHVLDAKTKNIPYNPKNYTWTMNYVWLPFER